MVRIIFIMISSLLLLNSCVVSKKKYEALLSQKNKLSKDLSKQKAESKKLKSNLNSALTDYNTMKGDFEKSNALKTDEIADLMIMITQLKEKSESLSSRLNETVNKFKAKEKDSYIANEELERTFKAVSGLQRDTASLNYSLRLAKERNTMLQQELRKSQEKVSASGIKRVELQKSLDVQTQKAKEMEMQLVKSQQNISNISKAFVQLRKELLTAKSNNKAIDPNKSKQIDKIAKLLGHY